MISKLSFRAMKFIYFIPLKMCNKIDRYIRIKQVKQSEKCSFLFVCLFPENILSRGLKPIEN